jgi:rhamnosyl/mannosyltransferase
LNIIQINKYYYPQIGGIEKAVQVLSESLLNDTNEVRVLCCQKKGSALSEIIGGVLVTRSATLGTLFRMPISFGFLFDFKYYAKNADIVHLHMPFPLADLALFLSRYKGKVFLYWHSDVIRQKKLMPFYKPLLNWTLRRADKIIAATKSHIESSPYLKPFEKKCVVIPYGLDISEYENFETEENFLETNKPGMKKILFVGRLVYYKGVNVLLHAFKNVDGAELFIVGKGELEGTLQEIAYELKITDKVHFLGELDDEDIKSAFADCDFFVLPSTENSEAFGIVQLEAMVYGKPVINTSLPTGVPEVSIGGETGLTVKPNDPTALGKAIQFLVEDVSEYERFSKNAYKRVRKHFDREVNMKRISDLYSAQTEN